MSTFGKMTWKMASGAGGSPRPLVWDARTSQRSGTMWKSMSWVTSRWNLSSATSVQKNSLLSKIRMITSCGTRTNANLSAQFQPADGNSIANESCSFTAAVSNISSTTRLCSGARCSWCIPSKYEKHRPSGLTVTKSQSFQKYASRRLSRPTLTTPQLE